MIIFQLKQGIKQYFGYEAWLNICLEGIHARNDQEKLLYTLILSGTTEVIDFVFKFPDFTPSQHFPTFVLGNSFAA